MPDFPPLPTLRHVLIITRVRYWYSGLVRVCNSLYSVLIVVFISLTSFSLELFLGIIVANLPTLLPLLVTAHQRMRDQ